jgi:hypothetical protein
MIIKIIPETDFEKARVQSVTHNNVGEFFIFGGKKDPDGDVVDFHDWSGSYMGLIGKIHYYELQLIDEQRSKNKPIDTLRPASKTIPMIKRSGPQDGQFQGIIEAKDIKEIEEMAEIVENNGAELEFPAQDPPPVIAEDEETDKPKE